MELLFLATLCKLLYVDLATVTVVFSTIAEVITCNMMKRKNENKKNKSTSQQHLQIHQAQDHCKFETFKL